jgi:hypothetical protein
MDKKTKTMIDISDIYFRSTVHQRFENGVAVCGLQNCVRNVKIESNINGNEGYTVTIFMEDGNHPFWGNNVIMAPKQMKVVCEHDNIIELRGFGYDENALAMCAPANDASFANYGILLLVENNQVERIQLNMYDRNISIVYFK